MELLFHISIFIIIVSHLVSLVGALPAPGVNDTNNNNTTIFGEKWKLNPTGRGTPSILSSCISTFGFCIWTAVHPNILGPAEGSWNQFFHKFILLKSAVFIPEGLLIFAIGQQKRSKKARNHPGLEVSADLVRGHRSAGQSDIQTEAAPRSIDPEGGGGSGGANSSSRGMVRVKLSMEEAFFIIMGGFAIEGPPMIDAVQTLENPGLNSAQDQPQSKEKKSRKRDGPLSLKLEGFIHHLQKGDISVV